MISQGYSNFRADVIDHKKSRTWRCQIYLPCYTGLENAVKPKQG